MRELTKFEVVLIVVLAWVSVYAYWATTQHWNAEERVDNWRDSYHLVNGVGYICFIGSLCGFRINYVLPFIWGLG